MTVKRFDKGSVESGTVRVLTREVNPALNPPPLLVLAPCGTIMLSKSYDIDGSYTFEPLTAGLRWS